MIPSAPGFPRYGKPVKPVHWSVSTAGQSMSKTTLSAVILLFSMGITAHANATEALATDHPLACPISLNCVNSLGTSDLLPLQFQGSPAQGMALLKATLATFSQARIVRSDARVLEAIFTTPLGFRDQVDFQLDDTAPLIHYRSRSLVGLYDFGKNRSRMEEFKTQFDRQH